MAERSAAGAAGLKCGTAASATSAANGARTAALSFPDAALQAGKWPYEITDRGHGAASLNKLSPKGYGNGLNSADDV
jgi:hypothetical protein